MQPCRGRRGEYMDSLDIWLKLLVQVYGQCPPRSMQGWVACCRSNVTCICRPGSRAWVSIQYSVIVVRCNGVIHRGQKPASRGWQRPRRASLRGFPGSSLSGTLLRVTGPLPSIVLRTEDMWHKRKNQSHGSGGVLIRVSKETLLLLNVHWCSVSGTKMLKTVH